MGPRIDPRLYQQSDPVLVQSLLAQQAHGVPPPFSHQIPIFGEPDPTQHESQPFRSHDHLHPRDTGSASHPDSNYGSPQEDSRFLSLSPAARLSVLDAPLPASFDSQGISYMARHGPVAASLPSKIGISRKAPIPLDSVSNLGTPSFGGRGNPTRGGELGSSPFNSGDESLGTRLMHSRRHPKPKNLSMSMPRVDIPVEDSDDEAFHFSGGEEDYIPTSIHDQVLTRAEQQRRYSRTEQDRKAVRESLSGIGTPTDSGKVGSPAAGSPSRYGPLFARQTQQQQETNSNLATSPSAFGHVGSPLRNSSLNSGLSPPLRVSRPSGDISPSFPSLSSPPRQSSMSMLSQQLSRTRISNRTSEAAAPNATHMSGEGNPTSIFATSPTANSGRSGQRNISGGSGERGQSNDRFHEENSDTVFSMEDDFEESRKRSSGQVPFNPKPAPQPAWSQVAARGSLAKIPPIGSRMVDDKPRRPA